MTPSPIVDSIIGACRARLQLLTYPSDEENASALKAQLEAWVNDYAELLAAIAAVPPGKKRLPKRMHKAKAILFNTEAARFCAALTALVKLDFLKAKSKTVEAARVLALAKEVNIWAALKEPVTVSWEPKDKGGLRFICKAGPLRKAQQIMLRDVLLLADIDNEFDFTRKGAGGETGFRDEVIKNLSGGYGHWWTADIVNCFPSLKIGHFDWLHIHSCLKKNVVCIPKCASIKVDVSKVEGGSNAVLQHLKHSHPDLPVDGSSLSVSELVAAHSKHLVRRGLPQGGCLSVLLARAFLRHELSEAFAGKDVRYVCWIDDLNVGTRTHALAKELQALVRERLLTHPAGPITLHDETLQDSNSGKLILLGYVFQPGKGYNGNPVHVKPGSKRINRFRNRLMARIWKAGSEGDPYEIAEKYALLWFGGNKAWTKVPLYSKDACVTWAMNYVEDWKNQVPLGGMTLEDWDSKKPFGGFADFVKHVPPLPPWLEKTPKL